MPDELFPPETVAGDSPRLRFIKQHGIQVHSIPNVQPDDEVEETGEPLWPWYVWTSGEDAAPTYQDAHHGDRATGWTLDEALLKLAAKKRWPRWK